MEFENFLEFLKTGIEHVLALILIFSSNLHLSKCSTNKLSMFNLFKHRVCLIIRLNQIHSKQSKNIASILLWNDKRPRFSKHFCLHFLDFKATRRQYRSLTWHSNKVISTFPFVTFLSYLVFYQRFHSTQLVCSITHFQYFISAILFLKPKDLLAICFH